MDKSSFEANPSATKLRYQSELLDGEVAGIWGSSVPTPGGNKIKQKSFVYQRLQNQLKNLRSPNFPLFVKNGLLSFYSDNATTNLFIYCGYVSLGSQIQTPLAGAQPKRKILQDSKQS